MTPAAAHFTLKPSAKQNGKHGDHWLWLIAAGKLFYGLLLVAAGVAALNLIGKNLTSELFRFTSLWDLDSRSYYVRWLLYEISGVSAEQLALLSLATFFYASLSFIEGFGLVMEKRWAQWLAILDTGSFVPLEIYELCKVFNWFKFGVLVLNVFTVAYLLWQTRKSHRLGARTR